MNFQFSFVCGGGSTVTVNFETGSLYVTQASLRFLILLPPPPPEVGLQVLTTTPSSLVGFYVFFSLIFLPHMQALFKYSSAVDLRNRPVQHFLGFPPWKKNI